MATKKNEISLYQKVVTILNDLQGSRIPDYQGLHAFWQNPEVFLNASLYGQRLIAPIEENNEESEMKSCCGSSVTKPIEISSKTSCCGSSETNLSAAPSMENPSFVTSPKLIAKSASPDCWPSGGANSKEKSQIYVSEKRSDRSAIIKGLKGLYPFDGSIFPRLLWDTNREAQPEDIEVIAKWIDSGCPLNLEEEKQKTFVLQTVDKVNKLVALSKGELLHKASTAPKNDEQKKVKGTTIRKEISSLTTEELEIFREAIQCMQQYNEYWQDDRSFDYWARIHTNSCQHGWEQFLPWHRLYLYFFEQKLQDFNPNIALPYWSWTDYADLNKTTFNNSQFDLGILPDAYGCYLTTKGVEKLKSLQSLSGKSLFSPQEITSFEKVAKKGVVYNSGLRFLKAVGIPYEIVNNQGTAVWSEKIRGIYAVLKEINPLWFPNRWPGSLNGTASMSIYPTKEDVSLILQIPSFNEFGGGPAYDHHFGSLEKVHNGMHNFSGGTNPCYPDNNIEWKAIYKKLGLTADPQSIENPIYGWMTDNRITAFDPVFWGHHSNVDRIWAKWQELHNGTPEEMDAIMAPWTLAVKDSMSIKKLGYTYMRDSVHFPVSHHVGLTTFKSEHSGVKMKTLDLHAKAEIVIHRIQVANIENAVIRVFLNTPDASIDTPINDNEHFVEAFTTFNGSCFGGPGHCNLPLGKTRFSDHRPLHHHEPRNFKINATDAVQRMLNKGEKDISIQLVITGLNGKPIDNSVFIEGVSLNFID